MGDICNYLVTLWLHPEESEMVGRVQVPHYWLCPLSQTHLKRVVKFGNILKKYPPPTFRTDWLLCCPGLTSLETPVGLYYQQHSLEFWYLAVHLIQSKIIIMENYPHGSQLPRCWQPSPQPHLGWPEIRFCYWPFFFFFSIFLIFLDFKYNFLIFF